MVFCVGRLNVLVLRCCVGLCWLLWDWCWCCCCNCGCRVVIYWCNLLEFCSGSLNLICCGFCVLVFLFILLLMVCCCWWLCWLVCLVCWWYFVCGKRLKNIRVFFILIWCGFWVVLLVCFLLLICFCFFFFGKWCWCWCIFWLYCGGIKFLMVKCVLWW